MEPARVHTRTPRRLANLPVTRVAEAYGRMSLT